MNERRPLSYHYPWHDEPSKKQARLEALAQAKLLSAETGEPWIMRKGALGDKTAPCFEVLSEENSKPSELGPLSDAIGAFGRSRRE